MKSILIFRSPQELLDEADREMLSVSAKEQFTTSDKKSQESRDKWCAAHFALGFEKHVVPCKVAFNSGFERMDADFFLRVGESEHAFQTIEVQEPGRRRGAEFKSGKVGVLRSYEPERGRIEGPTWIREAIRKKVAKQYAGAANLNLVVYANFEGANLNHHEVSKKAAEVNAGFASIWLITSLHIGTLVSSPNLGCVPGWGEIIPIQDYYAREDRRS